jgi:L-fuconolactonase
MTIIDSQVHAYEANTPKRPLHSVPNWPDHVTGDEMVAAMNKVGVDGAIFISAFSLYRYDASYAVQVQRAHPARFAIVKPVNPDDPAVGDIIADWKQTPGAVGIRIFMTKEAKASRLTRASTGSCARPYSTTFRSTYCAGATWMRARR